MKKILFIATGGTISCAPTENGLAPELNARELLEYLPELNGKCEIVACQPFFMDSTNMSPQEWITLADIIRENYEEYNGFVIAHGTDTMAYAAAALSCLIQGGINPIIITGSQLPLTAPDTDATRNLRDAFLCAAGGRIGGVRVVFGGRIIDGKCACKLHTKDPDAFRSINYPDIGEITAEGDIHINVKTDSINAKFYNKLDSRVAVIKLLPGAPAGIFDIGGARAVIIEGYGAGGLPEIYRDKLAELINSGVYVIMGTQVLCGGSDLSLYRVGKVVQERYDLPETGAMTAEFAAIKAMWALAHSKDIDGFKRLFAEKI